MQKRSSGISHISNSCSKYPSLWAGRHHLCSCWITGKEINRSSVKVLHVDGIMNDTDAKVPLGIMSEDVIRLMRMSNDLGLVHLRNYPRTGEQYTCLRGLDGVYYGILSKLA